MSVPIQIKVCAATIEVTAPWITNRPLLMWLKNFEKEKHFTASWKPPATYVLPLRVFSSVVFDLKLMWDDVQIVKDLNPGGDEMQEFLVEYIGACRQRDSSTRFHPGRGMLTTPIGRSYASAWTNGGWNLIFPEEVLRFYFPPQEKFDGDFYKALLRGSDLTKEYKKLARQFHPDLNRSRDAHKMFVKLREAYESLSDPMRRKRYEAGLKFQSQVAKSTLEVVFRIPKSCGRVEVKTHNGNDTYYHDPNKLIVDEIVSWRDEYDEEGRVMCSTWWNMGLGSWERDDPLGRDKKPFAITWEYNMELEIDV